MKTKADLEKEMINDYHDRINGTFGLMFILFFAILGALTFTFLVGYGVNALINLIIK